jgi:hypothetical protein
MTKLGKRTVDFLTHRTRLAQAADSKRIGLV